MKDQSWAIKFCLWWIQESFLQRCEPFLVDGESDIYTTEIVYVSTTCTHDLLWTLPWIGPYQWVAFGSVFCYFLLSLSLSMIHICTLTALFCNSRTTIPVRIKSNFNISCFRYGSRWRSWTWRNIVASHRAHRRWFVISSNFLTLAGESCLCLCPFHYTLHITDVITA